MAWLKIDDRVRTHPKVVMAGPAAAWFWFCGIAYCREHLTDGFIPAGMIASLAPGVTSGRALAKKLLEVGLWHEVANGYRVHDFLDWNPSREQVEAERQSERDRKRTERIRPAGQGTGIPAESSHARTAARGLGTETASGLDRLSEESTRETNSADGRPEWFWSHWRRLMHASSGIDLPLTPTAIEFSKVTAAIERVADDETLLGAVERFMHLSDEQARLLNVKAKTVGYFVMALPRLLQREAAFGTTARTAGNAAAISAFVNQGGKP